MKRSFGAISIGLNLVLLGILLFCLKPGRIPATPEPDLKIETASETSIAQTAKVNDAGNSPVSFPDFHWRELESDDYPTYMANLRAVRCPEKTIFDILFADIEKLFAERKTKLEAPGKFWIVGDARKNAERERAEKLFALEDEKSALIKTLLDSELDWEVVQDWYDENFLGGLLAFLPDAKALEALCVLKKIMDRFERAESRRGALAIPEDVVERQQIYSEMRAALGRLVSPAELEEGELRFLCLMSYLFSGNDLEESKLTGPELRQIMQLKLRFDNPLEHELAKYDGSDSVPEFLARQTFHEQVKKFLGETRFQQYLRAHDNAFDRLCNLTQENGLRPQVAMSVYEIQQVAMLESLRVRADNTLRRSERRRELQTIEHSIREAVQQMLGEKAAASYATNGGNWIVNLGKP